MENPVNYASLIQLAVTFNFVFVVFRHQSEDKAKMLIDTLIEKWKEQFQEETNALFIAIQEMVKNRFSVFIENPVIKKYHDELKNNYESFKNLISWYPRYLPRYCLMSGLYSLILLVLLAELNFKDPLCKAWQLFWGVLVICQILYNAYYILLETITAFQEKKQLYEQKYMLQLIIFAGIIFIGYVAVICKLEIFDPKNLFYMSLILAFSPFLVTFAYIIIFGIICICKLHSFISQIEAFRADFNKVVMQSQTGTYEYVTQNKTGSFEFYMPDTENTSDSEMGNK